MLGRVLLLVSYVFFAMNGEVVCFARRADYLASSTNREAEPFQMPERLLFSSDLPEAAHLRGRSMADINPRSHHDYSDNDQVDNDDAQKFSLPQKRRKGPTLSVVNPLEILRQRLMLDMARRRIHENQQQIVANAELLENLGKRSGKDESDESSQNYRR